MASTLTDNDRQVILGLANTIGFHGTGGCCGAAALAINKLLFNDEGQILIAANKALFERDRRLVGHVGVLDENGVIWDAEQCYEGEEGIDDFIEWGMIDPEDPEYQVTEEESEKVELIELSNKDARKQFEPCPHGDQESILKKAIAIFLSSQP